MGKMTRVHGQPPVPNNMLKSEPLDIFVRETTSKRLEARLYPEGVSIHIWRNIMHVGTILETASFLFLSPKEFKHFLRKLLEWV